jgi:hypothetical protein
MRGNSRIRGSFPGFVVAGLFPKDRGLYLFGLLEMVILDGLSHFASGVVGPRLAVFSSIRTSDPMKILML